MCGVVGIIGSSEASKEAFLGLTTLQHRGQDAAGILTTHHDGIHQIKNLGLVDAVFTRENMNTLPGSIAIGHARYSTIGRGDLMDVQPFVLNFPFGIGMVHNGNIINVQALGEELKAESRRQLMTRSDSEIILNIFADAISKLKRKKTLEFDDVCAAMSEVMTRTVGSYSLIFSIAGQGIIACRDPNGIRPLIWGKKRGSLPTGEAHMFASESLALQFNDYEVVRDVGPGEVIYIQENGKISNRKIKSGVHRPCMFEWVYFASTESVMDQVPVYRARFELGKEIARIVKKELATRRMTADLVAPVPDTSRTAALALAEELDLPYREVLIKNRYIRRTFILATQQRRDQEVRLKLSPVVSEIEGKNIILVDDSIVRGTTSKRIIELLRKAGAKKIYFVSTCPPVKNPCYYGIDFPSGIELIANQRSHKQIEQEIGADAVIYMDIDGLKRSILRHWRKTDTKRAKQSGKTDSKGYEPCMACLDGKYPTSVSQAKKLQTKRLKDRKFTEKQP